MLKKSLAWVLTLALLLSTVSGLALFTFAEGEIFAYASYVSGQRLYKNATENLYTSNVTATPMAEITSNADDRYAALMNGQNDQIGITIPASLGLSSNITIEVKFWADPDNQGETRLGMNYNTASGMIDYGKAVMQGAPGSEVVNIDSTASTATGVVNYDASGWATYVLTITDADYNNGGQVNFVKWSHDNNTKDDGWYIQSILVYDTDRGRPVEDQLYIREDTVGYIDFTADEVEKELLDYTVNEKGSIVEFDGMNALKIAGDGGLHLSITANDVAQPAVKATDSHVTVLLETYVDKGTNGDWNTRFCVQNPDKYPFIYGNGHGSNTIGGYAWNEWEVMRFDITDNEGVEFKLGTWFNGDSSLYIRKIVVCRTELVSTNTYDNAFVDFDNPVAIYNDFQRVETNAYNLSWSTSELAEGDSATVDVIEDKTAITAPSGYLYLNVADAFTKNGEANVPDLGITVTYLDKGEGALDLNYNAIVPEGTEDTYDAKIPYMFKSVKIADLTDSGEWKTVTVYVDDAHLRNEQNGNNDMRIALNGRAIAAVSIAIGADKAALNAWINKAVNTAAYKAETVEAYNAAKAAAQVVADNKYATKADVDKAVADMQTAFDGLIPSKDNRFDLINASLTLDNTMGSITTLDGHFVWAYTSNSSNKWFGIGDPEGILANSTSVTYEYEILMDTTNNNDRCFMSYGETNGWHGVEEGAWAEDPETHDYKGNGFAAGGHWGATPAVGEWGTIKIQNDRYDPTRTEGAVAGAITCLGSWMDHGTLYIRSVKVYDTADPTKMVAVIFKEDVAELIPSATDPDVKVVEKEGFQTWNIPSGWKALNIDSASLIADGTVVEGANNVMIEVEYWLDEWAEGANVNELLMIKHYNPDGNGQNDNKNDVCEHQFNSSSEELQKRGQWNKAKFFLTDANFGAKNGNGDMVLNITYGNGNNIYIRGIKLYEVDAEGTMLSSKPAQWGSMLIDDNAIVFEVPTYDWNAEQGYQLKVSFSEGIIPTTFDEMDGYKAAIITDDFLYVNVDDEAIPSTQKFIRIDITHQNGCAMHVEYNTVLPEGTDTSAEPNLSYYNFHSSNGLHEIVDGVNVGQGDSGYSNPLGVIRSVSDEHIDWMTTSIYLTDAQFRNSANGNDFRVKVHGGAVITKIEVYMIEESEVPAVGDATALQALYDELLEEYNYDFGDNTDLEDAFYEAEYFLTYNYRASQADVDAAVAALQKAIDGAAKTAGDVDGDGEITSTDARLVLQLYAKKITEADLDASVADVDGDKEITSTDARLILQLYAKKIDKFPIDA